MRFNLFYVSFLLSITKRLLFNFSLYSLLLSAFLMDIWERGHKWSRVVCPCVPDTKEISKNVEPYWMLVEWWCVRRELGGKLLSKCRDNNGDVQKTYFLGKTSLLKKQNSIWRKKKGFSAINSKQNSKIHWSVHSLDTRRLTFLHLSEQCMSKGIK